jgi:hypothetical protein
MDQEAGMKRTICAGNRGWVVGLGALAIFLLMGHWAWSMETPASGKGRTRQEAINNGLQEAVERALGTWVNSQTQVTNGELIWDRIASASTGYVRGYDVISERKDPSSGAYEVEMTVRVDDPKLQETVEELMKDPNFMKLIQETKFDQRKVVVLYVQRTKFDLPYDSKGVQSVMASIQDRLAEHQFRVFLQDKLVEIHGRMAEKIVDEETAIDLVRREKGDAAVVVSFDGAVRETEDGYKNLLCTLSLKAYDMTTGQFFASVQDRGKTISRAGERAIEDGVARIAENIGPKAADNLTKKIVDYISKQRKFHVLVLKDVSVEDQRAIKEILTNIGWRYRLALHTGTYLEMEIFTEADPTTVQNTLDKEFVSAKLPLNPSGMAGSRIEFQGKARGGQ